MSTGESSLRLIPAAPSGGRLVNLSARAQVGTGSGVLIGGLAISGGKARVLLRGIGPTLAASFGVAGALHGTKLTAYSGQTVFASNSSWGSSEDVDQIRALAAKLGGFPLLEGSRDSALVLTLDEGSYTFMLEGLEGLTGIGLLEIFIDTQSGLPGALVNLSARAQAGQGGDALIAGVAVDGDTQVLVRGVGPELARSFNMSGVLKKPELRIYAETTQQDSLQAWGANYDTRQAAALFSRLGAFPLPADSLDALTVLELQGGNRTIHVTGVDQGSGVAIMEVYLVKPPPSFVDSLLIGTQNANGSMDATHVDLLKKMGSRVTRMNFAWDWMEPVKGQLYLDSHDQAVDALLANGMEPLMTIMGSPSWLTGSTDMFFVPTEAEAYARWLAAYRLFVRRIAAHFAGRVSHWELWNEPNIQDFWRPTPTVDGYASWAKAMAEEILSIDPSAHISYGDVTVPEVGYNKDQIPGAVFIQGLYDRGLRPSIVSVHPYCYNNEPPEFGTPHDGINSFVDVLAIREVMNANGGAAAELWISEYAWWSGTNYCNPSQSLPEAVQADYFRRSLSMINQWPSVKRVVWFWDWDLPSSPMNGAGMARADGTLRPVADELRAANAGK